MSQNKHDTIFIGKKPLMSYVTSAILQLSSVNSINIQARGLSIAMAVDVTQILMKRTNIFKVGEIQIGSESLESQDGRKRDVSTIKIPISRIEN
ncbi:MAG: DNA-binding protein [Nitrosarchaeum sp.]